MGSTFQDPDVSKAFRPEGEMMSKMWIVYLMDLVWSFFFTFFFVKGYENRGIMEGIRFGIYIGLFFSMVVSYQSYVFYPLPYKVVLQMFLWGFVQSILCGIVAALVYKPKQQEAS
jgi:magnesium-transporting ATPase (P-type)